MRGSSWVAVVLVDLLAMVFVELDHIGGAARQVDHAGIPADVHHPQASALQRQRAKEGHYPFADGVVSQDGGS
ncbi:MAG: hypothetical protein VX346_10795 [Planctomycetota bacterium]|nr:hypothetical protein [Planctomycetota bacterium]